MVDMQTRAISRKEVYHTALPRFTGNDHEAPNYKILKAPLPPDCPPVRPGKKSNWASAAVISWPSIKEWISEVCLLLCRDLLYQAQGQIFNLLPELMYGFGPCEVQLKLRGLIPERDCHDSGGYRPLCKEYVRSEMEGVLGCERRMFKQAFSAMPCHDMLVWV